jgi:hypothetical protein
MGAGRGFRFGNKEDAAKEDGAKEDEAKEDGTKEGGGAGYEKNVPDSRSCGACHSLSGNIAGRLGRMF